jgi:hypothetical protein
MPPVARMPHLRVKGAMLNKRSFVEGRKWKKMKGRGEEGSGEG